MHTRRSGCTWSLRVVRRDRIRRTARISGQEQSRNHSVHIGQDVIIHYRWHPLYGRSVHRVRGERRASGEVVYVEVTPPGVVMILPAWKLDAVYWAGLKVGALRNS